MIRIRINVRVRINGRVRIRVGINMETEPILLSTIFCSREELQKLTSAAAPVVSIIIIFD